MADDGIDPNATGGELRTKLTDTMRENRTLAEENHAYKAKELIATEGLTFITPDDLKGVAAADLKAKAIEMNTAKVGQLKSIAEDRFKAQGYQGAELDRMVTEFVEGKPAAHEDQAAYGRARSVGTGGSPVTGTPNAEGMSAQQKMRAGLEQQSKNRK